MSEYTHEQLMKMVSSYNPLVARDLAINFKVQQQKIELYETALKSLQKDGEGCATAMWANNILKKGREQGE